MGNDVWMLYTDLLGRRFEVGKEGVTIINTNMKMVGHNIVNIKQQVPNISIFKVSIILNTYL